MQKEEQYITAYRLINKYNAKTKQPKTFGTPHTVCGSEAQVLDVLESRGEMTATGLAHCLGITKGAVSQTLSKLTSKNLIEKRVSRGGYNEVKISLSEAGKEVMTNYRAYIDCRLRKVVGILEEMSPAERARVAEMIAALEGALDQY